ncbi:MAG TPA: formylmethanofuran dehydrogenase subunit C, partial [Methylophilaceae bacterium]|nr:formylmethanofuran dehydrogenase subunit C [Methylophilaceae bacterium]
MSALTFTLKIKPQQRIDCSPLTPDNLVGKSIADIAAIEIYSGKQKLRADAVFAITGDDASHIVINKSCNKLDYIGRDMKTGRITIHGDAGSYLGFQMSDGEIILHG